MGIKISIRSCYHEWWLRSAWLHICSMESDAFNKAFIAQAPTADEMNPSSKKFFELRALANSRTLFD